MTNSLNSPESQQTIGQEVDGRRWTDREKMDGRLTSKAMASRFRGDETLTFLKGGD